MSADTREHLQAVVFFVVVVLLLAFGPWKLPPPIPLDYPEAGGEAGCYHPKSC